MNKKLLVGFASVVATSAFWACGEGDVFELTGDDKIAQYMYVDAEDAGASLETLKNDAIKSCKGDPLCVQAAGNLNGGDEEDPVLVSSSSEGGDLPILPPSSSSRMDIIIASSSSVGGIIIEDPSSSGGTEIEVVTGLGSCAPTTTPISKGGGTTWKFTLNKDAGYSPTDFIKAAYDWNFGAAGVAAGEGGMTSSMVTYAASGSVDASVTVTLGTVSETIKCKPLQVNGDPITGCKCVPAVEAVDYLTTPDVAWSVTGCTSTSMPLTYSWEGAAGEATFTKTFTAATAAYAPKLQVGNTDNTIIDVTCAPVKVTEGAEYTITDNQSKVEFPAAGKYNVVIGYACQNKTFYCNGNGAPVGGSVNGVAMASSWYTTANLTAADCSGSATVVVEVDGPASCGAQ